MRNSAISRNRNQRESLLQRVGKYIRPSISELLTFFLLSFILILVQELAPDIPGIPLRGEITVLVCLSALAIEVVTLYKRGKEAEQEALLEDRERRNRWAKAILSGIAKLPDNKADSFRSHATDLAIEKEAWPFFYNPDDYLRSV